MRKLFVKNFKIVILFAILVILMRISFKLHFAKHKTDVNFIRLDRRAEPNETLIYQHISNEMPYLPVEDLNNISYKDRNINYSCAWYPSLADVKIRNDYWQEFQNTNITYYIFGAYLDKRPSVVKDEPVIRILTMMNFIAPKDEDYPQTYCQFWYVEQREPIIMPANVLQRLWYYEWGHGLEYSYGHLLTCYLPKEHLNWIPKTVSLVSDPCHKATNNIRVTYFPLVDKEVKQNFAVCIKGLDYPYRDISHRLVEFMEAVRSLGADKIIMYNLQVHPNISKVLNYYEHTGYLEVRPLSVSSEFGSLREYRHMDMTKNYYPYVLHEVIPYNDCLYRNMYRYDYVAVVDIDEIIMPLGNLSDWYDIVEFAESVKHENCQKIASFCFRCIYFPRFAQKQKHTNEFPEYFYMLHHVERVKEHMHPDLYTKCFHNTDRVVGLHNHFPFHVSSDSCHSYSLNASHGQLQHYREPPAEVLLNETVIDKSLWRFKEEIIERATKVFKDLQYFKEIDSED